MTTKTKNTKVKHDFKCDKCEEPAVYNLQDWWHLYEIGNTGKFTERKDWEADTNEFYCEECYEEEFK